MLEIFQNDASIRGGVCAYMGLGLFFSSFYPEVALGTVREEDIFTLGFISEEGGVNASE